MLWISIVIKVTTANIFEIENNEKYVQKRIKSTWEVEKRYLQDTGYASKWLQISIKKLTWAQLQYSLHLIDEKDLTPFIKDE